MTYKKIYLVFGLITLLLMTNSCKDDNNSNGNSINDTIKEVFNPDRSFNANFDGKLFSIPSPIQTALLIKSLSLPFNETLLNNKENISKYVQEDVKAINLGVYSADLGYVSLYNQSAKSINYMSLVESLANDLGISGAFDKNFIKRFENNTSNEDSLLVLISHGLRKADNFLKENDRKNMSALILTGGWVESMYLATQIYNSSKNNEILIRIGEQKQSLTTILELLERYNSDGANDKYITLFNDLQTSFSQIETNYEYIEPVTDKAKKLTTIKSKMTIVISDELMTEIIEKMQSIRSTIVMG
ncbi:MAG: hypothetical protein H3C31_08065 [Brumimicrobium sp.]|nr:hypothetical protein [Brumimicrobium sp.]